MFGLAFFVTQNPVTGPQVLCCHVQNLTAFEDEAIDDVILNAGHRVCDCFRICFNSAMNSSTLLDVLIQT